jgi:flavin-dependent dehydrogenase
MGSQPDVLVAGAGPAGSLAALVLARAGARVLLVDRARFPRDKLCGDTVNPGALAILERLGIGDAAEGGLPVEGMVVTGESGVRCEGRYGEGAVGRALPRRTLDAALLSAAVRAGACVNEGVLAQAPIVDGGRVVGLTLTGAAGRSQPTHASLVIAADGAGSRIARGLCLARHASRPRRWAVAAYFENVAGADRPRTLGEMHIRRGLYIGVAPLPKGLTNACVVTADRRALRDPDSLLLKTLAGDADLADRFARARQVSRTVCLGPLAVTSVASGVPGLLLAGDAAGFIDPMTGDGLRFAFRGGELAGLAALSALERGDFDVHRSLWQARRREFSSKWRFNRALRMLVGSPTAVRLAGAGARASPRLVARAIRYAGDVSQHGTRIARVDLGTGRGLRG